MGATQPGLLVVVDRAGAIALRTAAFDALPEGVASDEGPSRARLLDACVRAVATGAVTRFALDGAEGPRLQCVATPVLGPDGAVAGGAVAAVDVGELQAELARRRRHEALLVDAQGVAHLGVWEWSPPSLDVAWSEELFRIYGETPRTYRPTYEGYLKKVVPEDRERVAATMERVFREHVSFSHDERIRRPDGTVRHLHTWGHPVFDEQGRFDRLIGVCQDITARKEAEQELEETLAVLTAVVEGTTDAVFVKDLDGRYLMINRAGAALLGSSKEALIGHSDSDVVPPETAARVRANDAEAVRLGSTETFEETVLLSGVTFTLLSTRGPFRDAEGRVVGTIGVAKDITSLKRYQRELEELVSLQTATLESTADGILAVATDGRVVAFNQRLLEVWQLPRTSLVGRTYEEALGRVNALLVHPEACARRFVEILGDPIGESFDVLELLDGRVIERYSRPQRTDGETIGRVFSYRDVTERVRAERAVKASEARMRALAETSVLLAEARLDLPAVAHATAQRVAELFEDGSFVRLLRTEERRLDTVAFHHVDPGAMATMHEVLPNVHEFLDEATGREIDRTGTAVVVDLPPEQVRSRLRPEVWPLLDRFPVRSWMVAPLRVGGRVIGYVVVFRFRAGPGYDEDDRDFLQNLVDRAALAIDNARLYADAQTSVMLRDEFIHAASHELRTPVTPLKVRLQLLSDQVRSAPDSLAKGPVRRLVEGALRDLDRLVRLITDMVAISRLDAGDLHLATEEVDLVALVREAVAALGPEITAAGCTIVLHGPTEAIGWWDTGRLRQVVLALLSNAVKFGAGHPIDVTVDRTGDRARLEVHDRGMGVATVDQARIFERFVRAVPTRHFGGLGLGLYIVRRVVEAHGGSVRLQSAPGQGSTFVVELPAARPTG